MKVEVGSHPWPNKPTVSVDVKQHFNFNYFISYETLFHPRLGIFLSARSEIWLTMMMMMMS